MPSSSLNTNAITALGMCKVCTEAVHSVALGTRTLSAATSTPPAGQLVPVWLGGCGLWFCQSANSTLSIKLHSVMCLLTRTKKLENKKDRNKKEDKKMVKSGNSASGTKMQKKEKKE